MTTPWYRPDQAIEGRANVITDKIGKVYLHQEFDHHGDLKQIHISQPQKFRETGVEEMLEGLEERINATLTEERKRRAA